jgi:hypothetical protein
MNESSENNPVKSYTGNKRGYMVTNNDTLVMPTQSHAPPSTTRLVDPPQEPLEDIITPSTKKPRGRPLGSKNKPKPPPSPLVQLATFEIPAGMDIPGILINYARENNFGIAVLSGFGTISSVTLLDPISFTPKSPIAGPFYMTSLTGTYVNPNCHRISPIFINDPISSCFSIFLASNDEHVHGGIVGGEVITADVVTITTLLFRNPEIYREGFGNGGGGVINNVGLVAPQPNNINNVNVVADVPNFNAVGVDPIQPNHHQMPLHHLPNDYDVMQWNDFTHFNSY